MKIGHLFSFMYKILINNIEMQPRYNSFCCCHGQLLPNIKNRRPRRLLGYISNFVKTKQKRKKKEKRYEK